ncbi:LacI family DNA-binding transcriptional regulator [Protaetiibacter sp. SSC-01]|uniref:LacI family DNA-binding transcriptional regulator n=1 Tax=Protaetiibacter sp. SSC-01 TaxID=2759943 RepID=UPI0016570DC9|nr:LacI family DNA-binding transcriptional regulator [Protaetiibacter sp. SSC-01]QNO38019.1 LacI family DNA-binding transcriptional regulator [Protaetiibacter sp. SSC-01]
MAVSIRDVAERAGVSVGTVSNVLNRPDRVSDAVVGRVHDAIRELGYVRNDAARQLRAGRSSSVGLVVLDARNPFFTDIARGAEDEAAEHGVAVLLGDSDEKPEREAAYLDLFEEQRVRGVLVSPLGDIRERLERLRALGTPVVLVDRMAEDDVLSSVSVDDHAGGRTAVAHLLEQGRRRIAFVAGPLAIRQVADRLAGAREAVDAVPDASLEVLEGTALSVLEGRRMGEQLVARPASERPDAVFAANDLLAVGLLQALVMRGEVRVPEDVAIVGFDDIDFAAATVVPLSSIRQPSRLIGQTALRILLEEADDPTLAPRQVVFQPELVVRESSAF